VNAVCKKETRIDSQSFTFSLRTGLFGMDFVKIKKGINENIGVDGWDG